MARILIDGFESGDLSLWHIAAGAPTVVPVTGITGMSGNYCANLTSNDKSIYAIVPSAAEYYVALRLNIPWMGADSRNVVFVNGATELAAIGINTTNRMVNFKKGDAFQPILAMGARVPIINNATHQIQIYYKAATTGGRCIVKVDGLTEIDFTGNTTVGPATIDKIYLGKDGNYGYFYGYVDDVVIDGSQWPGNTMIQGLSVNGAGNMSEWTPSAGANYQCLDEIPPSDVDYISVNLAGKTDSYLLSNLVGTVYAVRCVQVQARGLIEGNPAASKIKVLARIGGADNLSPGKEVASGSPTGIYHLWETNPSTGLQLSTDDLNGMEAGIQSSID